MALQRNDSSTGRWNRGAPAGPRDERTDAVNRWPAEAGGPVRYRAATSAAAWSAKRCAHGGDKRGRASFPTPPLRGPSAPEPLDTWRRETSSARDDRKPPT